MKHTPCSVVVVAVVWLVVGAVATPVRRSPDLEARRRSAIDRSLIRFGRSYPPEPSAADLQATFQRPTRRGNSFLRFGRSQPITFTTDDLIALLKSYEDDYDSHVSKKATSFIRLGRDPKFIRLGRAAEDERVVGYEQIDSLNGYPQRKSRARDHFVRLGRDSEELNDVEEETEERRKRSAEDCHDCQS